MNSYYRLHPSLDKKLKTLQCLCADLTESINEGKLVFSNNEKMVKFSQLITKKLLQKYKKDTLTDIEVLILENIIKDGFDSIIFCLLEDSTGTKNDCLIAFMKNNNFIFIEGVGYISIE